MRRSGPGASLEDILFHIPPGALLHATALLMGSPALLKGLGAHCHVSPSISLLKVSSIRKFMVSSFHSWILSLFLGIKAKFLITANRVLHNLVLAYPTLPAVWRWGIKHKHIVSLKSKLFLSLSTFINLGGLVGSTLSGLSGTSRRLDWMCSIVLLPATLGRWVENKSLGCCMQ